MLLTHFKAIDRDGIELKDLSIETLHYLHSIGRLTDSSLTCEETSGLWVPLNELLSFTESPVEEKLTAPPLGEPPSSQSSRHEVTEFEEAVAPTPPPIPFPEPITEPSTVFPPSNQASTQKMLVIEALLAPTPPLINCRRGKNWIAAHWTGDLPLVTSYWGIGILVYLLNFVLAFGAAAIAGQFGNAYSLAIYWILFWSLALSLLIWLWVGIWRSANRHASRGGNQNWATVAKAMVVLGALSTCGNFVGEQGGLQNIREALTQIQTVHGFSKFEVRPLRNGTEIEIRGPFGIGIADAFEKTLAANPDTRVIQIDSTGGLIAEAKRIRELIRSKNLTTYAPRECTSAGTVAFMGGVERFISEKAKLGFHQPTFPTMEGQTLKDVLADEQAYMVSAGVAQDFIKKAYSFQGTNLWYPTHAELLSGGVITGVTTGDEFGNTAIGRWKDKTKLERDLLQTPIYQALKDQEPAAYAKILTAFHENASKGESVQDLRAKTLPLIQEVAMRRLPRASDDAVLAFTETMVAEIDILSTVSPENCYNYLFPSAGLRKNYAHNFDQKLIDGELDAITKVITTYDANLVLPTEKEISKDLGKSMQLVLSKLGKDSLAVFTKMNDPIARAQIDKRLLCSVVSEFYKSILKLPRKNAARTLRFLFAGDSENKGPKR